MSGALLEVNGLHVSVGKFSLKKIDFTMSSDDYVIIVGPTGCGKTVLLEALAGLRSLECGAVYLNGREITHLPPEQRRLGFAYQDSLLYPFMSVKENILFGARAQKMENNPEIKRRLEELVEAMNITHLLERQPRFLSGGERQRISLARAILTRPPLLLLDEPLSALDPQTRQAMQDLLREIHLKECPGIIHVTHDFSEALQLGTRMIVLQKGRIEQKGEPADVFFHPANEFVARFLQVENLVPGGIFYHDGLSWFEPQNGNLLLGPLPERYQPSRAEPDKTPSILFIRSGNLRLSRGGRPTDAFNSWTASVEHVSFNRAHVDVYCSGNGRWQASLSLTQWQELKLAKGDQVAISVGSENFHLIPRY